MTRKATYVEAGLCGVLLLLGFSLWQERNEPPSEARPVARQATLRADTVRVVEYEKAKAARVVYRTLRDTLLAHTRDTLTLRTIERADAVIVQDSVAYASAMVVVDRLRDELRIAQIPRPDPRLRTTVAALYDPVRALPVGSVQVGFRVIRSLSLVGRVDQRLGETPRVYVGMAVSF